MTLTKQALGMEFASQYKKYYEVELFRQEGFVRKICSHCGKGFWTLDTQRNSCGDSSHTQYSFIKENGGQKIGFVDFWKKFAEFWKKRGHEITPRYPVISRWRDDLYFTIASIVDFQRLEAGKTVFEYPANPLVVPQICLRFNDVANVGVTGRHFSGFMMAGQHAFDCNHKAYWKDGCIRYNFEFLTQVLNIPKEEITYGEDVWAIPDNSSLGPCIESFSKGSELVNSVFTEFREGPGNTLEPLDMKVIDVGWGFERLLWYASGAASAYDATFWPELEFMRSKAQIELPKELTDRYSRLAATLDVETVHNMREEKQKIATELGIGLPELEKTIAPMQALYAIADHSRSLLFALSDGALPSNAAGGYNLRLLARRAFSFLEKYPLGFTLFEVMEMHAKDLKGLYPELSENLGDIQEIIGEEKRKYTQSRASARKNAQSIISKGKALDTKELFTLYESNGVTPEILEEASAELGKPIEIPSDFYKLLTDKHLMQKHAPKQAGLSLEGLEPTRAAYYELPYQSEWSGKVLRVEGNKVVLDQTIFYPEGGGQISDTGTLGGLRVLRADKVSGVVIHTVENASSLKVGETVKLALDWDRRLSIMRHHSATHVMIQTARRVLGNHVWQCGSLKEEGEAHVDITHYRKLTAEEKNALELAANLAIWQARPILMMEMPRGAAEEKYGFRLYQGGGAIGKLLRIVEIAGYDVQACGGVHVRNTGEIGMIKLIGIEHVQDGVVRLRYRAGPMALKGLAADEAIANEATGKLSTTLESLPQTIARLHEDWKESTKEVEKLYNQLSESLSTQAVARAKAGGTNIVQVSGLAYTDKFTEKLALAISSHPGFAAVVSNEAGFVVCACHPESGLSASELLTQAGAKGGGSAKFARGKLG